MSPNWLAVGSPAFMIGAGLARWCRLFADQARPQRDNHKNERVKNQENLGLTLPIQAATGSDITLNLSKTLTEKKQNPSKEKQMFQKCANSRGTNRIAQSAGNQFNATQQKYESMTR